MPSVYRHVDEHAAVVPSDVFVANVEMRFQPHKRTSRLALFAMCVGSVVDVSSCACTQLLHDHAEAIFLMAEWAWGLICLCISFSLAGVGFF